MNTKEVLKDFMCTPSPAGYEQEMSQKIKEHFEKYCDEVFIDNVGNCIGKQTGWYRRKSTCRN